MKARILILAAGAAAIYYVMKNKPGTTAPASASSLASTGGGFTGMAAMPVSMAAGSTTHTGDFQAARDLIHSLPLGSPERRAARAQFRANYGGPRPNGKHT